MLSPTMTVVVLAVLWLIVVVPMIFRRHDAGERERSVAGFGRTMRALGRRAHDADTHTDVYVPGAAVDERAPARPSGRRPVPAAEEALMYPVDRSEMTEARAAMMARRRRSLGILGAGTIVLVPTALIVGGIMWLLALPFLIGLAGYMLFLRSQAQRDRDRRYQRQQRATVRRSTGVDVTVGATIAAPPAVLAPEQQPESLVRIDDDDIELHNLDTIDLTGLYQEELADAAVQRRAS